SLGRRSSGVPLPRLSIDSATDRRLATTKSRTGAVISEESAAVGIGRRRYADCISSPPRCRGSIRSARRDVPRGLEGRERRRDIPRLRPLLVTVRVNQGGIPCWHEDFQARSRKSCPLPLLTVFSDTRRSLRTQTIRTVERPPPKRR